MEIIENQDLLNYQEKYFGMKDYIGADFKKGRLVEEESVLEMDEKYYKQFEKYWKQNLDNQKDEKLKKSKIQIKEEIIFNLENGQNILVYGLGSKLDFLKKIKVSLEQRIPILEIQGFVPSLSIRVIIQSLAHLVQKLLGHQFKSRRVESQLSYLEENSEMIEQDYLLIILHNIDSKQLRTRQIQSQLGALAQIKKIRILASIDHIRYFSIVAPSIAEKFNFKFQLLNTLEMYDQEIQFMISSDTNKNDLTQGLKYVLESFTDNQRNTIFMMARWQYENKGKTLSLNSLWNMSFEEQIFTSRANMEQSLFEIIDHSIFKQDENKNLHMNHYTPNILQKIAQGKIDEITEQIEKNSQEQNLNQEIFISENESN